ncbi:hypothetical protein fugu_009155 [Takifugu bimaculatus]|uniref:Uncharacterized protein n=1 Tax=Takifugu bimaculatus TaxID=433685 RepID=A0A4Z2AYH0_9TELE|nr:hypothetical protein fugu_009155 [Takifugu bimaculatus]
MDTTGLTGVTYRTHQQHLQRVQAHEDMQELMLPPVLSVSRPLLYLALQSSEESSNCIGQAVLLFRKLGRNALSDNCLTFWLFDTTDPDEEQHAPFRNRAKVRLFPGNICRLLFKNLPNGKSNFTCNIKYGNSSTVSKTSVVEKSKMALLASPSGVRQHVHILFLLQLLYFCDCRAAPPLLGLECPVTELQRPAADLDDTSCAAGMSLAVIAVPKLLRTLPVLTW